MDKKDLLSHPYGFWIAGLMLLLAFLVTGGISLAMEHYRVQVEADYRAVSVAYSYHNADQESKARYELARAMYQTVRGPSFSRTCRRMEGAMILSAVGILFWIIGLVQKVILLLIRE